MAHRSQRGRPRGQGWGARQGRRGSIAALAALAAVAIALVLHQTHALESIELKSIDARFRLRGTRGPPSSIVIVGIDPQTFTALQLQWPFPRSLHAELIRRLKRDGARAIVYDVQFTEPSTPVNGSASAKEAANRQDDDLIEAVHKAGNVVLASSEVGERGETDIFGGGRILTEIGARAGAAIVPTDTDGVDRRMLVSYHGLRTLGVVAAEAATGRTVPENALAGGSAYIDFVGPAGTIPSVSFASALRGEAPARTFAGKTVIVGAAASNLQDVHETPFGESGLMSGAELTANAMVTVEEGFPLHTASGYLALLLIIALATFAPILGLRVAPGWVLAAGAVVCLVYGVVVQVAFQRESILPLVDPLCALFLGCVGAVAADSLGERRRLQALGRELGARSVAPSFFISYRRDLSSWQAWRLRDALVDRFGESSVFIDAATLDAGEIWPQEIEEASARCGVMLVLLCPDWVNVSKEGRGRCLEDPHDWVRREVEAGLGREDAVVVPVLHDRADMPARKELPEPLRRLVDCHAETLSAERLNNDIDRLVASIDSGRMRDWARRSRIDGAQS
jgi:CHASE2 domain-containing sensor protein